MNIDLKKELIKKTVNFQLDLVQSEKDQLIEFMINIHEGWSLSCSRSMSRTMSQNDSNKFILKHQIFLSYVKKFSRMTKRPTLYPKTDNYKKKVIKYY
jgi:hypothetical protein